MWKDKISQQKAVKNYHFLVKFFKQSSTVDRKIIKGGGAGGGT